jgi:hypothetical protein
VDAPLAPMCESRLESLGLAGAESLERGECGRPVSDVLECPGCGLDLRERRLASLDAETREPPQRGAFEPIGQPVETALSRIVSLLSDRSTSADAAGPGSGTHVRGRNADVR